MPDVSIKPDLPGCFAAAWENPWVALFHMDKWSHSVKSNALTKGQLILNGHTEHYFYLKQTKQGKACLLCAATCQELKAPHSGPNGCRMYLEASMCTLNRNQYSPHNSRQDNIQPLWALQSKTSIISSLNFQGPVTVSFIWNLGLGKSSSNNKKPTKPF